MKKSVIALLPLLISGATLVHAENAIDHLQVGGGLSYNQIDSPFRHGHSEDANGVNMFVGYEFDSGWNAIDTSVEVGFNRTDRFDEYHDNVAGPWVALVGQRAVREVDPRLSVIGRVGLDVGDDDGVLMGVGFGFMIDPAVQLRAEYINRDATTQMLGSVVVKL
ncbi:outer membrane beta-barrel protein [Parathalassolituus penaei]|uniref:Outer membrane protein beta-barrel domain-containing protein n=1 Tax=Parathalassolituus penaei TaxID=2997323 RepID=A0A9X3EBE9_9GAMM|nr:outer membrane beta-barrel protein [Parathalassolituus penaei]MCY0964437.1 hypothetical protein [Parathalassolituus penaei]